MQGHHAIHALRRRGFAPALVQLCDFEVDQRFRNWQDCAGVALVEVEQHDKPELLDLRFCFAMQVFVAGWDAQRAAAIGRAAAEAGAKKVMVIAFGTDASGVKTNEVHEVSHG